SAIRRERTGPRRQCITLKRERVAAGGRVPNTGRAVRAAGEDAPAVGRKGDGQDRVRVSAEGKELVIGDILNLRRAVVATRDYAAAIPRDGNGPDQPRMTREQPGTDPAGCVPQLHLVVPGTQYKAGTSRGEGERVDHIPTPFLIERM